MALLVSRSRFGLNFSIIRFFPGADKSRIFSTSAIITTFFAVIFGAVFTLGVDVFSPELYLLKSPRNAALFLIFLAASSVTALTGISFIAIRRAGFQFPQSIVVGTRILFLIPLVALGAIGIFSERGCRPLYPCIRRSLRSVGLFAIKRVQKDVKGIVVLSGVIFGLLAGVGFGKRLRRLTEKHPISTYPQLPTPNFRCRGNDRL